jgi:hypothetical protein
MAERASAFDDLDVSEFSPKKPAAKAVQQSEPPPEAVRAVSETANFRSREPIKADVKPAKPDAKPVPKMQRRRRTGRNEQLNLKVTAKVRESFYQITDSQGWVLGETFEKAIEALQRELAARS